MSFSMFFHGFSRFGGPFQLSFGFRLAAEGSEEAERLRQIAERLQEIGADDAEPRATKILRGGRPFESRFRTSFQ